MTISSSVPNSKIRSTSACDLPLLSNRPPDGRSRRPPDGRTSEPLNLPSPSSSRPINAFSAFSISSAEISPSLFSSSATMTGNDRIPPPERFGRPRRLGSSSLLGSANSILPSPHEIPTSKSSLWVIAIVLMVIECPLECLPNLIGSTSACVASELVSFCAWTIAKTSQSMLNNANRFIRDFTPNQIIGRMQ